MARRRCVVPQRLVEVDDRPAAGGTDLAEHRARLTGEPPSRLGGAAAERGEAGPCSGACRHRVAQVEAGARRPPERVASTTCSSISRATALHRSRGPGGDPRRRSGRRRREAPARARTLRVASPPRWRGRALDMAIFRAPRASSARDPTPRDHRRRVNTVHERRRRREDGEVGDRIGARTARERPVAARYARPVIALVLLLLLATAGPWRIQAGPTLASLAARAPESRFGVPLMSAFGDSRDRCERPAVFRTAGPLSVTVGTFLSS